MMMEQTFGISLVGVILSLQLMLLPDRSITDFYSDPTRPRLQAPVASEGAHVNTHYHAEISWIHNIGWMVTGLGQIKTEDLEEFLRASVNATEERGLLTNVRVRIPPDAQAKEFLYLMMCMQRVGVYGFGVVVTTTTT
jgi:hypothetical protein